MKFIKVFFAGILLILLVGCSEGSSFNAPFDIEEISVVDSSEDIGMGSNIYPYEEDTHIIDDNSSIVTESSNIAITTTTTTETTTSETTSTLTTTTTTVSIVTTVEETTTYDSKSELTIETTTTPVYIVYKPKTHYFHKTTCRWFDDTCIFDWDAGTFYGRICSECQPEVHINHVYEEPVADTLSSAAAPISQSEFYMLANLVAYEYGADWVPVAEKAKVIMTVMNRVRSNKYPNTIKAVILQKNQYCWVPNSYYWSRTTQSCKDAVSYYFAHQQDYSPNLYSFYGDGWTNHFY